MLLLLTAVIPPHGTSQHLLLKALGPRAHGHPLDATARTIHLESQTLPFWHFSQEVMYVPSSSSPLAIMSCGLSQNGAGVSGEQKKSLVGTRVSDACSILSTDQLPWPVRLGPRPTPPQELLRCTLEMPAPGPTHTYWVRASESGPGSWV